MFDADILYTLYACMRVCVCVCMGAVTFANVCIEVVARHRTTVCNFSLRFQFAEITIKQVLCIGFIISTFRSHSDCLSKQKVKKERKKEPDTKWMEACEPKKEKNREKNATQQFSSRICCF